MLVTFKERLQEAIDRSGLSDTEIAVRAGVSISNIKNWRRGVEPKVISLGKVASVLGVSVDELLDLPPRAIERADQYIIRTVAEALLASLPHPEQVKVAAELARVIGPGRLEPPAAGRG